jgi:cephalosporin hydroxylase
MTDDRQREAAERSPLSGIPKKHLKPIFKGTMRYTWRGVLCNKSPFDLALYSLLIWQQKPRTIIEFGTKQGGSALWFHDLCRTFGLDTRIISIDIHQRAKFAVDGVSFLSGDALDPEKALPQEFMNSLPRPLLVIDDSAHLPATVLSILRFFDSHLAVGEYVVIEDGILQSMEMEEQFDGGPLPAIRQFLAERHASYAIDTNFCDFFGPNATFNTNGFLVKTAA